MASESPKFKLRDGLRSTNIVVIRDGKRVNERVEPGVVYEGEEYIKWCPMILTLIESKLTIDALKKTYEEPMVGKVRRLMRLRPPMAAPVLSPKAVMRKVDAEASRGQFPKEIPPEPARPPRRPRPATTEKKPVPKAEAKPGVDKAKEKAKLEQALEKIGDLTKPKLMDLAKSVGLGDKVSISDLKADIEKTMRRELKRMIRDLSE